MAKNVITKRGRNPFPEEIKRQKKRINSYKSTLQRKVDSYKNAGLGQMREIQILENRLKSKYFSTAGINDSGKLKDIYDGMMADNKAIGSINQGLKRLDATMKEFFADVDTASMTASAKVQLNAKFYEVVRKVEELIKDRQIRTTYDSEEIQETLKLESKWKDLSLNVDWNSDVEDIAIAVGMQIGEVEAGNAVDNLLDFF